MQRLDKALRHRSDRGTPVGADAMIERVAMELQGQRDLQLVDVREGGHETATQTTRPKEAARSTLPPQPRWRTRITAGVAFSAAFILIFGTVGVIGVLGLLGDGIEEIADMAEPTVVANPQTTVTASLTEIPAAITAIPALGEGWEIVLSNREPDLDLPWGPTNVVVTTAGYYVEFYEEDDFDARDWYLMTLGEGTRTLVDIDVPADGFATGGPGVVAWANVGPEADTEAQLWVSSDGIGFVRVAEDLLAGCDERSDCHGTEIYAAAASPAGRIVALAYDPLIWNGPCECFEFNPVALVSDDGYNWTRHSLDLASLLPEAWAGAADIRSPLLYVDGLWLTYGWSYQNSLYSTDTAFFASENGVDWEAIDTGNLFEQTYLMGVAANDRGVVAITGQAAYWSADGINWTRTGLTSGDEDTHKVAAYDDGFIVVSAPRDSGDGSWMDAIRHSPDGTTWTRISLELEEPAWWNSIVGDGPNLAAVGATQTNLLGIWLWSTE